MIDLTRNRYSSAWRADNAGLLYQDWEKLLKSWEDKVLSFMRKGSQKEAENLLKSGEDDLQKKIQLIVPKEKDILADGVDGKQLALKNLMSVSRDLKSKIKG